MKASIVSFLLASVASTSFGAEAIITKGNYSGFVQADYVRTELCEVFADKVVITHYYGANEDGIIKTVEERQVAVGGSIQSVVAKAAAEAITVTNNSLCDGPSTSIEAHLEGANANEKILLFNTGGCGSSSQSRNGANAQMLVDLVNQYCPITYDFSLNM